MLFYAGFYLLQILLAFYTLGSFRWEVLMLAAVSFPIYLSALVNAFAGKEQKWHVTGSTTKAASPFNFIIPQVLAFVFLLLSSVVSIWRDLGNSQLSLATAWSVTNTFILGAFMVVALKESWHNEHPRPVTTPAHSPTTSIVDRAELRTTMSYRRRSRTPSDPSSPISDPTQPTIHRRTCDNERTAPVPAGARRAAHEEAR